MLNIVALSLLDRHNLNRALDVAKACFPVERDWEHIQLTYQRFVSGTVLYRAEDETTQEQLLAYFLFCVDSKAAAVSGLYRRDDDPQSFWIGWFGVHPDFRGQGIARAMVAHLEQLTHILGGQVLRVFTSVGEEFAPARRLYESAGFERTGRLEFGGEEQVIYSKTLRSG